MLRDVGRNSGDSLLPGVAQMGGLHQHRLQTPLDLGGERVGLAARPVYRDGQRLADVHAASQRAMGPARVGGVFLEPLDGLQEALDGRIAVDVSTRVKFEGLSERAIVQVPPACDLLLGRAIARSWVTCDNRDVRFVADLSPVA